MKKKKIITKEMVHEWFMDYAAHEYDALGYVWQFSSWKRLSMDRSSYLDASEKYFEKHFSPALLEHRDAWVVLVDGFNKEVEILEIIKQK